MSLIERVENYPSAITVEKLAELTSISAKTIYRHIRTKKLLAFRIGGLIRLDPETTATWLRSRLG